MKKAWIVIIHWTKTLLLKRSTKDLKTNKTIISDILHNLYNI